MPWVLKKVIIHVSFSLPKQKANSLNKHVSVTKVHIKASQNKLETTKQLLYMILKRKQYHNVA